MIGIICIRFASHSTDPPASFSAALRPAQSAVHPWLRRLLTVQPASAKHLCSSERQEARKKSARRRYFQFIS